jgi:hypothetical protein
MKKELSKEQINRLYRYVNDNGVEYFDVQVELVDHIASKIEEQLDLYPETPTDEVFEQTLKRFKQRGFKQVVKEKEKQVARQYRRYWREGLKEFFTWPKVFFTAVLMGVLFAFLRSTSIEVIRDIHDSLGLFSFGIALIYAGRLAYISILMPFKLSFTNHNLGTSLLIMNAHSVVKVTLAYTLLETHHLPLIAAVVASIWLLWVIAAVQANMKLHTYSRQLYPQAFKAVPKLV